MLSYCLKCRKIQKVKIQKNVKATYGRIMLLSKCKVCDKAIKEQEACGLLSSLGIKTPSSKIPLVGSVLF